MSIDGQQQSTTATKNVVTPEQHQFSMILSGYEPWQKTLTVEPGGVTWLNYARLVPVDKRVTTMMTLSDQQTVKVSPDKRFFAGVSFQNNQPQLTLIDFRDSRQPNLTTQVLDGTVLSGLTSETVHNFTIVEWSYNSRYLLIKHVYRAEAAEQTEWLLADREAPSETINITTKVNLAFSNMQFAGDRELYGLQDNGDLRRISADSNTVSGPVLSQVTQFQVYAYDIIAYTAKAGQQMVAGIWKKNLDNPVTLATVNADEAASLRIRVGSYFNQDTAVVSRGTSLAIYRGQLPSNEESRAIFMQSPQTFTLNRPATNIQLSDNGRFVIAEDETGLISYDLERKSASQELKKYSAAPVRWLDHYHIWQVTEAGQLEMQEFDGVNSHELMASSGYDVLLTQDQRYIYGFVKNSDGTLSLNQLAMTI